MSDTGLPHFTLQWLAMALVFPPLAAALALARLIVARGPSRWLAGLALLTGGTIAALLWSDIDGPALGGLSLRTLEQASDTYGWLVWIAPVTVPLALSGLVPGTRWRWIDLAHGLAIAALALMWWLEV